MSVSYPLAHATASAPLSAAPDRRRGGAEVRPDEAARRRRRADHPGDALRGPLRARARALRPLLGRLRRAVRPAERRALVRDRRVRPRRAEPRHVRSAHRPVRRLHGVVRRLHGRRRCSAWSARTRAGRWTFSSSALMDILLAFPQLILALAIASILGPAVQNVVIAITIPIIPRAARVVRATALVREGEPVRRGGAGARRPAASRHPSAHRPQRHGALHHHR